MNSRRGEAAKNALPGTKATFSRSASAKISSALIPSGSSAQMKRPPSGRVQRVPRDHLAGPHQHRGGGTRLAGHDVGAVVHAVGEVDVQPTGRSEHHLGPRRSTAEGVRARVRASGVRLDLGQAHGDTPTGDPASQEVAGHGEHVTGEELHGQAGRRHPTSVWPRERAGCPL